MGYYINEVLKDPIYINGVRRLTTGLANRFYADSDDLPGRRCSEHTLKSASVAHLKAGGKVRTSGNWYSLHPDKEVPCTSK